MRTEQTLWAVKIGDEDWQEVVITSTNSAERMAKAKAWAKANGYDRFRVVAFNWEKPDFGKAVQS